MLKKIISVLVITYNEENTKTYKYLGSISVAAAQGGGREGSNHSKKYVGGGGGGGTPRERREAP